MNIIAIDNFREVVVKASGLEIEPEAPVWAKWIDSFDTTKRGGFIFVGDFIPDGTVNLNIGTPRLILVCAPKKDRSGFKGFRRYFRVLILDAKGDLKVTHISDNDSRMGWAVRICELASNLLDEMKKAPDKPQATNRFALLEIGGDEAKRGTISACDACGKRKLTAALHDRDGARLCDYCAGFHDHVTEWSRTTGQTEKAHHIISIILKR